MNHKNHIIIANSKIELVQTDITTLHIDAIVNAANSQLVLGSGVAGAIKCKAGPSVQQECNNKAPCPAGNAVITTAGNLSNIKFIIHAVGPRQGEGCEDKKLANATINSLKLAENNNLSSIAFPAISTGIFGYPIDKCAKIMMTETYKYLTYMKHNTSVRKVIFCLFDKPAYDIFLNFLNTMEKDIK